MLEGRVEYCLSNSWTVICGFHSWDDVDAKVVCTELGYSSVGKSVTTTCEPMVRNSGLL